MAALPEREGVGLDAGRRPQREDVVLGAGGRDQVVQALAVDAHDAGESRRRLLDGTAEGAA